MTRDLPLDDDAERAEGSDTAYRVANGVARVARAGAYVTGGALVAANGTAPETTPGTSNADSRYAGWSTQTVSGDPSPDAPSPVMTFPDLTDPPEPAAPTPAVPHGPFGTRPPTEPEVTMVGRSTEAESGWRPEIPGSDGDTEMRIPGSGETSTGFGIPSYTPAPTKPGLGLDDDNPFALPGGPGLGLPGPGMGIPGFDGLPGQGIGIPGYDGLPGHAGGLPGFGGIGGPNDSVAAKPGDGPFDGIGDMFDGFGAMVNTEWQVDAHVGLDGVWFTSQMKVTGQVGQVGDQLDDYGKWLGDGIKVPGGADGGMTSPTGPSLPGSSSSGVGLPGSTGAPSPGAPLPGGPAAPSTGATPLPGAAAPALPGAAPAAPLSHAPAPAPAPVAPAPAPPAPVAPAPAPVAPAAPAPVALNPVVSTPLQTTIQPDAASTPIANVFGGAAGAASPLTAPAATAPSLFAPLTPTTKPVVVPDVSGGTSSSPSPATVTPPSKLPTADIETPTTVKLPDLPKPTASVPDVTKPHVTTPPTAGTGTGPVKPTRPGDDDITTPGGTTGGGTTPGGTTPGGSTGGGTTPGGTTGGGTPSTAPTVDVPDPTVSNPTVSVPTQPVPTKVPTVDIDPPSVVTPPPVVTVQPTQAPIKPPVIDTKPIAADFDHHAGGYHGVSAGLFDTGLGGVDQAAVFPAEPHGYDFV
ncbi:hypothetical protein [Nocardia asteroides]|uniref:hypothetical protein n=1 Tax=Nocardia asteroides TaxID=1824 RepID=UPI001E3D987B|nr:hypothetical protein [Nocardia asteroides]UGT54150.1 hypothetical protein LTT85_26405 [Nocardia asteroides]